MLTYKFYPADFGLGVIIPSVEDADADTNNSENYRGITLSPVVSKVFEMSLVRKIRCPFQIIKPILFVLTLSPV